MAMGGVKGGPYVVQGIQNKLRCFINKVTHSKRPKKVLNEQKTAKLNQEGMMHPGGTLPQPNNRGHPLQETWKCGSEGHGLMGTVGMGWSWS